MLLNLDQLKTLKNQSINFGFGPSFELNNVTGSPTLGFNNSNTISLRSERVGSEGRPSSSHTFPHTASPAQLVQIELLMLVMLVLLVLK